MLKKIKYYIRLKLGILAVNQRLDFLSAYLSVTYPNVLHLDPIVLQYALGKIEQEYGLKPFNTAIHKNDLMFAFHVYHHIFDVNEALRSYYKVGVQAAKNLSEIVKKHNLKSTRMLDFGSGYGRVTRFLPQFLPKAEITISEVKSRALEFQKEALGFPGILHTQETSSFPVQKFDLILCLSVFTHLPNNSFEAWIDRLVDALTPGGALIFTYNQVNESNAVFRHVAASEDTLFSFVADSLNDTKDYGNTHVSNVYLENLLQSKGVQLHFLNNTLVEGQEALLAIRV